jgi:hypothetical protein
MAAAIKSNKSGGKFGHMHLILSEKEYCIATKDSNATVNLLTKPPNVNPEFKALIKDKLMKYKVLHWRTKPSSRSPHTSLKKKHQKILCNRW